MYWFCGLFILTGLVLSNAYKGNNISTITESLIPVPIESFIQLLESNYDILSPYSKEPLLLIELFIYFNITTRLKFLRQMELNEAKLHNSPSIDMKELYSRLEEKAQVHFMELHEIRTQRLNYSYFNVLSNCNNSAVAGWSNDLKMLQKQLRSSKKVNPKHISIGKQKLYEKKFGWRIEKWTNTRIFTRFLALHESGILNEWVDFENTIVASAENKTINKKNDESKSIDLSSNIISVFIILAIGLGFGIVFNILFRDDIQIFY